MTTVPAGKVRLSALSLSTRVARAVIGAPNTPISMCWRCSVAINGKKFGEPGGIKNVFAVVEPAFACIASYV